MHFKTLFLNDPCLGKFFYPLEDEGFPVFWYLQVAHHCRWATSRLDVFDLNKIFLKSKINNIKTEALLRTWKLIANSISFKRAWNC